MAIIYFDVVKRYECLTSCRAAAAASICLRRLFTYFNNVYFLMLVTPSIKDLYYIAYRFSNSFSLLCNSKPTILLSYVSHFPILLCPIPFAGIIYLMIHWRILTLCSSLFILSYCIFFYCECGKKSIDTYGIFNNYIRLYLL